MDPLSVTASIAGIVGVCVQAAHSLDTLRSKFQNVHITITALSSQCRAIKTGLSQLQTLILQNHTIRDRSDVMLTLDTTLTGCLVVLSCFEDSLEQTGRRRDADRMKDYLSLLQGQQSAIAFLVQVLHMNSIDEILEGVRNGKGLLDKQATKAESLRQANPQLHIAGSVLGPRKTADTIFRDGGDTVAEGVEFEFDNTVVNSKAYRRVMAMAKEVVTKRSRPQSIMKLENMSFDSKAQSPNFLAPISEASDDFQPLKTGPNNPTTDPARVGSDEPSGPQGIPTVLDVLRSKQSQIGSIHGTDYFDMRCQRLFSAVHAWVLRFSKFSDLRASRLCAELNDEKLVDRLDNTILNGSDVDTYLADRVKRRDVFTSMVITMIWEFIFTRYLFGMDRGQRQKLKTLEKQLSDFGPPEAVRAWRATTLSLLSRRPSFKDQLEKDVSVVAQVIFDTLAKILPPPSHLEDQLQAQLRRVVDDAVELSILMRTQPAEFMMLPPLQPEYADDGELVETATFNSALMSQPGSHPGTMAELEANAAVVRVVLFPLVVQKGNMEGIGDDEVVVFPAQVLVQPDRDRFVDGLSVLD
ncbi:hypothetical protein C8A05DRAFT_48084 [Staphylotrichum tortipilum]|uniref:Azaphilone pigments biosynthesis cluster protein L N-terminal domain-containing protein n=1 Tax=Staphylotrichum tortipilum TaxID=2831512 RepID=A0AAN6RP24_9PEZI|nr:hypothetical protein C8A05DRAFT_48084 [Staphylotrichum longicolle]